jgi:hypothetical protein
MENKTVVINLFGGSGCGKSTTAALLFARMKLNGMHVELVREYVKYWAWNDRKVREWDQLYLLGKQSAYESMLYGKVDFIVTDSPILLAGIYQDYRSGGLDKYVGYAAKSFMNHAKSTGVEYVNLILKRTKPFDPRGRWETEEEAKKIDEFVRNYLVDYDGIPIEVYGPNNKRDEEILNILQANRKIESWE